MEQLIAAVGWPLWADGLLVGINLAFGGATLMGMALATHSANFD